MPGFVVQNFGCRASQADGAGIESQLREQGLMSASDGSQADLVVLNTCTVTESADQELRHMVRRVHRNNPSARIVITGCYAQREPEQLAALPGVSLVVGNSHKHRIGELLSTPYHGEIHVNDIFESRSFSATPVDDALTGRARPNLKIQDGCGNRCSFCIIPSVRGHSRSAALEDVVNQVESLSARYPEIVLTGINLGRWGREAGMRMRLADLLRILLEQTAVQRIRLSSVEPMDWSADLLELAASSPRIAKHVHAPLQSGSDAVLRRMHRKYRPRHYADRIRLARTLMPDAAIGADVMAGFPGETEQEFEESRKFIEELPLTYLHVFPYSRRPGTPAGEHSAQVPSKVCKERAQVLQQIGSEKNRKFRASMAGKTLSAVTLLNGQAMSSNYLSIELVSPRAPMQLVAVRVGGLTPNGLREWSALPVMRQD